MGLGNLGKAAIEQLKTLGFQLSGRSRSSHDIPGVRCFAGSEEFADFLGQTDILVCLLPLTDATRGILCSETFNLLPKGARLVNAGLGGHLREADLLQAQDNPLWQHPQVQITPHIAATTQVDSGCEVLLENIRRHRSGLAMKGEVDRHSGY